MDLMDTMDTIDYGPLPLRERKTALLIWRWKLTDYGPAFEHSR